MGCVAPYESSRSFLASQEQKAAVSRGLSLGSSSLWEMLAAASWDISSIQEQGAGSAPGAGHPAEQSQCNPSPLLSQQGSREQFYRPQSAAVSLLSFMWAALRVLQPAVSAASTGLLHQVPWGWCPICFSCSAISLDPWLKKMIKDFCSRGSKSCLLLPVPMLNDLVAIPRNARKAFSLVDRLSLWSFMDTEHVFLRAVCAKSLSWPLHLFDFHMAN